MSKFLKFQFFRVTLCLNKPAKIHQDEIFQFLPETFPLRRPPFYHILPLPQGTSGLTILTQNQELFKKSCRIKHPFKRCYEFEVTEKFSGLEGKAFSVVRGKIQEKLEKLISKPIFEAKGEKKGQITIFDYKPDNVYAHLLALRHEPKKVKRISIGEFKMSELKEGEWREMTEAEINLMITKYYKDPERKPAPRMNVVEFLKKIEKDKKNQYNQQMLEESSVQEYQDFEEEDEEEE